MISASEGVGSPLGWLWATMIAVEAILNAGGRIFTYSNATEAKSDLGQWYLAIDPGAIGDPAAFEARLEDLLAQLTEAPLIPNAPGPVLWPGQPEAERAERMESQRAAPKESRWEEIPLKALFELEMTSLAPKLSRISVNSSK